MSVTAIAASYKRSAVQQQDCCLVALMHYCILAVLRQCVEHSGTRTSHSTNTHTADCNHAATPLTMQQPAVHSRAYWAAEVHPTLTRA